MRDASGRFTRMSGSRKGATRKKGGRRIKGQGAKHKVAKVIKPLRKKGMSNKDIASFMARGGRKSTMGIGSTTRKRLGMAASIASLASFSVIATSRIKDYHAKKNR